ncbi:MAG: MCP four helix bundle domain-containing protein, partial [Desulfovermiculus sp.]
MKMKLGAKIGSGFGVLIIIAVILGGLAVFNMNSVSSESQTLAQEYVPEVDVGAKIRGAANRIMYAMRGYGFTEDETYYQEAQKELQALKSGVDSGRDLASQAESLIQLGPSLDRIEQAMGKYEQAMGETHDSIQALDEHRSAMDSNAQEYMQSSSEFLESQNQAFQQDLNERQDKIALAISLVELGGSARVSNFKAQATEDMSLMQAAIDKLDEVDKIVPELRKITQNQEDIKRIKGIASSAKGYQEAMREYLQNQSQDMNLERYRQAMDANAENFVQNCDAFLKGQQQKLTTDMQERHTKITLANDVIDLGNEGRLNAFRAQAERDPELIRQGMQSLERLDEKFNGLREITRAKADLNQIDAVEQAGASYKQAMQGLHQEWEKLQSLGQTRDSLGSTMIASCREMANAALEGTKDIAGQAMNSLGQASWIMIVGLITALIMGVLIAYFLTRSITRPVNRIVQGLKSSGEQVSAASAQVASSSQSSAEGANEQASSLEESSSSLEEMSSQIKHNAD